MADISVKSLSVKNTEGTVTHKVLNSERHSFKFDRVSSEIKAIAANSDFPVMEE